jgi:hypothetical protein
MKRTVLALAIASLVLAACSSSKAAPQGVATTGSLASATTIPSTDGALHAGMALIRADFGIIGSDAQNTQALNADCTHLATDAGIARGFIRHDDYSAGTNLVWTGAFTSLIRAGLDCANGNMSGFDAEMKLFLREMALAGGTP